MGGFKDKEKQKSIVRENFKNYVEKLGRVPSYNEMRKTPVGYKYLSASSIERNFGSYTALLDELGLTRNAQPNQCNDETFFTDAEIINAVHEVCQDNLCYYAMYYHRNKTENMPGLKAIKLHFGSWYDFLVHECIIKDFKQTKKENSRIITKIICNDDHVCDSQEEAVIDYWLQKNNITHLLHPKYLTGKYKADFIIPHKGIYIEYAGCINRADYTNYNSKLTNKIETAKQCGMNVIVLTSDDLSNLDQKLNFLLTEGPLKTDSN